MCVSVNAWSNEMSNSRWSHNYCERKYCTYLQVNFSSKIFKLIPMISEYLFDSCFLLKMS